MAELPRMNDQQLRRAKKLIQKRCCNYDHGNCLALDDGEFCECVQCRTYSLLCKWFCDAVLPSDPKLAEEMLNTQPSKYCCICGSPFHSQSNRAKYCPSCAAKTRRSKEAERLRKHYRKSRI